MATANLTYTTSEIVANGFGVSYSPADIAFVLFGTCLVWIMIPGIGFLYAGLLRRKSALTMLYLSFAGLAVVTFQWTIWGYSLAFSETGSEFIGDLRHFALRDVLDAPSVGSPRIPAAVYMIYQLQFSAVTAVLTIGAFSERGRPGPIMAFVFVWSTLVYDPVARWVWAPKGWLNKLGGLDFAGGGPVHIASGTAALAISIYLGKRKGYGTEALAYRPNNTAYVVLGTVFLWFGWFGFNGGSALAANLRATNACIVTNIAASMGGLTWVVLDWTLERHWSTIGFCSGAVAGLVAITPCSGYVEPPAALAVGVVAGAVCERATSLKFLLRADDALDLFSLHAVGGFVGNVLCAFFAQKSIASLDGTTIKGGLIDHHPMQIAYQVAESVTIMAYSFTVTYLICMIFHFIPGLSLRSTAEEEELGTDEAHLGEFISESDLPATHSLPYGGKSSHDLSTHSHRHSQDDSSHVHLHLPANHTTETFHTHVDTFGTPPTVSTFATPHSTTTRLMAHATSPAGQSPEAAAVMGRPRRGTMVQEPQNFEFVVRGRMESS